ncbi:polysaccharide deacetylase family protein [Arhodomonas sp. AD133]|uniref:polysaccharide deacetylase family protein n=1 Tax=Arhodomonas sp. AD133 TaxID=3415009 RepID=UPI003EB69D15
MRPCAVLRFDVDTELCLREGVEPLCRTAERHDARLTFFVNPGRAIDRRLLAHETLFATSKKAGVERAPAFGALSKLGRAETIRLLMTNPRILPHQTAMVRRILDGGHEVGLHGGHNHATWQRKAGEWSREQLTREVCWGKTHLEAAAGGPVRSFASPGWNSPDLLPDVLIEQEFEAIADFRHPNAGPKRLRTSTGLITSVPNTLAGEPGGVGYLETRRAAGLSDEAILAELDVELAHHRPYICLYDHPFYAGRHAIGLFERVMEHVLAHGYDVITCSEAAWRTLLIRS